MKWAIAEVILVLVFCAVLLAMYDAGKRSVVRQCVVFHTFTYAQGAWRCEKMRTALEREKEEAKEATAKDYTEI